MPRQLRRHCHVDGLPALGTAGDLFTAQAHDHAPRVDPQSQTHKLENRLLRAPDARHGQIPLVGAGLDGSGLVIGEELPNQGRVTLFDGLQIRADVRSRIHRDRRHADFTSVGDRNRELPPAAPFDQHERLARRLIEHADLAVGKIELAGNLPHQTLDRDTAKQPLAASRHDAESAQNLFFTRAEQARSRLSPRQPGLLARVDEQVAEHYPATLRNGPASSSGRVFGMREVR